MRTVAKSLCVRWPSVNARAGQILCVPTYAYACSSLGLWYEDGGEGVTQDIVKAKEFYKKACDGKDEEGCSKLDLLNKK